MVLPTKIIKLANVNYSVKSADQYLAILKNINLEVVEGVTIAITGASGSGKSSLLHLMAGLELPTSGHIFYNDEDITELNEDHRAQRRAHHIGFIFQSFQLLPNLTALENVLLPLEIINMPNPLVTAENWLAQVGLQQRAHHYPLQLSGGEQQRVAIARAFAVSPKVLFADEPTGNLDKQTGKTITDLLFSLNSAHQTTLIIVTHDEALAQRCQLHWPIVDGCVVC